MTDIIIQALAIGGVTALATGFVNGKIIEAKLKDLIERVERIEHYLDGRLKAADKQ